MLIISYYLYIWYYNSYALASFKNSHYVLLKMGLNIISTIKFPYRELQRDNYFSLIATHKRASERAFELA